jgi:hypothetical protein
LLLSLVRRCLLVLFMIACQSAIADNWTQPTPDELKMTVEPGFPGAAVTCLARSVWDDYNHTLTHQVYVRLKILTEEGRKYADVEIAYDNDFKFRSVEARTIHSDGTAIARKPGCLCLPRSRPSPRRLTSEKRVMPLISRCSRSPGRGCS